MAVLTAKSLLFYSIRYVMGRRYLYQDKHTRWCHHPNFAQCQSVLTQCLLAHKREVSVPPHMAVIVCLCFSFYPHEVPPTPLYPSGTRGFPASSVSNPAVATARFSDGEKRQIVSRLGFAPHDTQSVFQARHRKRAPGAFSPCFPTGSTKLSFLEPTASSVLILAAPREKTNRNGELLPMRKALRFCLYDRFI